MIALVAIVLSLFAGSYDFIASDDHCEPPVVGIQNGNTEGKVTLNYMFLQVSFGGYQAIHRVETIIYRSCA